MYIRRIYIYIYAVYIYIYMLYIYIYIYAVHIYIYIYDVYIHTHISLGFASIRMNVCMLSSEPMWMVCRLRDFLNLTIRWRMGKGRYPIRLCMH